MKKRMINYINQKGVRTSLVLTSAVYDALDRLARKYGYTKAGYIHKIVNKRRIQLGNTDFIRDRIVMELLNLVPKKNIPEARKK